MSKEYSIAVLEQFGITITSRGELPVYRIENKFGVTEFTTHGAHVLSFTPAGAEDLLWVSGESWFTPGKPIRGGIPVCWPWFGPAGTPAHGVARIAFWDMDEIIPEADGSTSIVLTLDKSSELGLTAKLRINAGAALTLSMTTRNVGVKPVTVSEALHSYFAISDITKITVNGLESKELSEPFFPGLRDGKIYFEQETDLVCQCGDKILTVDDPGKNRMIRVERFGCASAVVWNPWIEKSKRMVDYGDNGYPGMVCVEAANARSGAFVLLPGNSHTMGTRLSLI